VAAAPTAAGAAGAIGIGAVVVVIIIANEINKGQEVDKDWQSQLFYLGANARALNAFEASVLEELLRKQGRTWTTDTVADPRLVRVYLGSKLRAQGWRAVYRAVPAPGDDVMCQWLRAFSLEYLASRAYFGAKMLEGWNISRAPEGYQLDNVARWTVYNLPPYVNEPADPTGHYAGVGGVCAVPYALGGATMEPRKDGQDPLPSWRELQAPLAAQTATVELSDAAKRAACLAAFMDACRVLRFDPRPGITNDRAWYAREVLRVLTTGNAYFTGIQVTGTEIHFDAATWGANVVIDPAKMQKRESGGVVVS
jgi:hypothetical protein